MASYVTQLRPDIQYQSQIPTEQIAFALQSRQQRYDHEFVKTENFLAKLSSIDLAKVEDQEHFNNNLKAVHEKVKQAGTGDLSVTGAGEIMAYIGQAADDAVVNGYVSTKQYRAKQAEWDELKKKNPELYNDANYQYSMLNTSQWLSDGQVGTSLSDYSNRYTGRGVGEVNPYVDVLGKANKLIKDLEPESYVTFDPAGDFQYFKKNGEKLTDDRIVQAMETMLLGDPQVQKQIAINSWSQYGNLTDEQFIQNYKNIQQGEVNKVNETLKSLNAKLALTSKPNQKAEIQNAIKFFEQKKRDYSDTDLQQILNNRVNIERNLYTNNLVQNIADTFKYDKLKDAGFEMDREGFERWKEGNTDRRHKETLALKQQESDLKSLDGLYKLKDEWVKLSTEGKTAQAKVKAEQYADYARRAGIGNVTPEDIEYGFFNEFSSESKSTIDLAKEMTDTDIALMALQEKDNTILSASNATQDFITKYFDVDLLKQQGLINPDGTITERFKHHLLRSENDLAKGDYVDALLDGFQENLPSVLNEFRQVEKLNGKAKEHERIYQSVVGEASINKEQEIRDLITSTSNTLGRNPFNVFDNSRDQYYTTNKFIPIVEQGNIRHTQFQIVESNDGSVKVYKHKDERGISVVEDTKNFSNINDAISYLALTSQKDISENYAKAYKDLYGGEIQGVERVYTGQADVKYFQDAVNMAEGLPDNLKVKYSNFLATDYKLTTTGTGDKKSQTVPPRITVVTVPTDKKAYIQIGEERYPINTAKDPNSIVTRDVQATLTNANDKKELNIDKNRDKNTFLDKGSQPFYKPSSVMNIVGTPYKAVTTPRVISDPYKKGDIQYQLKIEVKDKNTNQDVSKMFATDNFGRTITFKELDELERYKSTMLTNPVVINTLFKGVSND